MIGANNEIYAQIRDFLLYCSKGSKLNIYNASTMTHAPIDKNRIEFHLSDIYSMGHNYRRDEEDIDTLAFGISCVYKGWLDIRVISDPIQTTEIITKISNMLNHFDARDSFMPRLSIHPETMLISHYPVRQDGTILDIERIKVKIDFMLTDKFEIDWFNKIENVKLIIDGKEEVV